MSVELYLARRYLLDRRHGAWGWLISLIATGSVAIGVAALIVTLAVMTGFREDISQKMLGVQPHVFINSFSGKIDPNKKLATDILSQHPKVQSWSPYVSGQILLGRGKHSTGATVKGIVPSRELSVANLENKLVKGQWSDLETPSQSKSDEKPKMILGQELARQIGARIGDIVWIVTPSSLGISALSIPKAHLFEVSGIVHTGLYDYDSVLVYTNLESAQKLFGLGEAVSGLGVRISHSGEADQVAEELRKSFEGSYWVRSWLAQNKNLFSALKLERTVMFIILTLLTVVAAFMIVSNLLLNITQKFREIGILRAMGAPSKTIKRIFLYQGLLMGGVGNLIGVFLGIAISITLSKTNLIRLPADVYYIDHLPIRLVPLDIISVIILAALIVLVATLYPAQKAAKLDPLDAIRYG